MATHMTGRRRYRLLCPIARALDVLGDRWTLLILRDLQAGPARYQELQEGLGIATNLLSTRLAELTEQGMIARTDEGAYRLTDAGRRSDLVLWELARFGAGTGRDPHPREPGNLRTLVLPLRMLLRSAKDRPDLRARLVVDGAELTIRSTAEEVDVAWGRTDDPVDVVARTTYPALLDVGEGVLAVDDFVADHLQLDADERSAAAFLDLLGSAMVPADDPRSRSPQA